MTMLCFNHNPWKSRDKKRAKEQQERLLSEFSKITKKYADTDKYCSQWIARAVDKWEQAGRKAGKLKDFLAHEKKRSGGRR